MNGAKSSISIPKLGIFNGIYVTQLNHGVVVVGYGTENGKDYLIVRNSWGDQWGELDYIGIERNLANAATGKCGIAIEVSYPIKKGQNPPNLDPSPIKPPTVCDNYYSCSERSTCCCIYEYYGYCFAWGCCPLESATCCDDHDNCCPHDYPVCDINGGTCLMSEGIETHFLGTWNFWHKQRCLSRSLGFYAVDDATRMMEESLTTL